MYSIRFKCKVITPLFMYGADGITPELRTSEFKGMMRFWWRAIKSEGDIGKLKDEESKIFGGTDEKSGKSKLRITFEDIKIDNKKYPLPLHKNSAKALCIEENSTFDIVLETFYQKYMELYKNIFLASVILGGFGKRARRGFGSISVEDNDYQNVDLNKIGELLNSVSNSKNYRIENNKILNTSRDAGKYPWIKEVLIGEANSNWKDLLIKIGKSSHYNNCDQTGYARGKSRFASPIYVSVIKNKNKNSYKPVITKLNSDYMNFHTQDKSESFIKNILGDKNE